MLVANFFRAAYSRNTTLNTSCRTAITSRKSTACMDPERVEIERAGMEVAIKLNRQLHYMKENIGTKDRETRRKAGGVTEKMRSGIGLLRGQSIARTGAIKA